LSRKRKAREGDRTTPKKDTLDCRIEPSNGPVFVRLDSRGERRETEVKRGEAYTFRGG